MTSSMKSIPMTKNLMTTTKRSRATSRTWRNGSTHRRSNTLDPGMDDDEENIDEDLDVETYVAEDVAFLVGALATIADPVARSTIKAAFREGLVDESMTSKEQVAERYAEAKEWVADEEGDWNWLDNYRMDYEEHLEEIGHLPRPAEVPRPKYRYQDRYDEGEPPSDIPATAPIRNAHSKLGRNDPCWCGSGKKFKKCHLGKDGENVQQNDRHIRQQMIDGSGSYRSPMNHQRVESRYVA